MFNQCEPKPILTDVAQYWYSFNSSQLVYVLVIFSISYVSLCQPYPDTGVLNQSHS